MNDYLDTDTTALVDLLAIYTEKYTRFLNDKRSSDEFTECKQMISMLQSEIHARHRSRDKARSKRDQPERAN